LIKNKGGVKVTISILKLNRFIRPISELAFRGFLIFVFGLAVFGQSEQTSQNVTPKKSDSATEKPILQPVFTSYKGLSIGATRDLVKEKLGKPKIEDEDGFYFIPHKDEQVQIRLDENKKVSVIAVTYSENHENTPKYEEVFGKDVALVTKPDGSVYNLIRYPSAGIWIAYSKTTGEEPTVTVTIQKLSN
jgi:hypothetical protein